MGIIKQPRDAGKQFRTAKLPAALAMKLGMSGCRNGAQARVCKCPLDGLAMSANNLGGTEGIRAPGVPPGPIGYRVPIGRV